jgi:hypothetical protein
MGLGDMSADEKLVAVISPWEKLGAVVKQGFRVESLPRSKQVAIWRDDLQSEQALAEELAKLGIEAEEIRAARVTTRWQNVD